MSLTREERLKIDLATEARIRAEAAAERTREIAERLRDEPAAGNAAGIIEWTWPDAFPKPGGADE
jgi:hypothetical protein